MPGGTLEKQVSSSSTIRSRSGVSRYRPVLSSRMPARYTSRLKTFFNSSDVCGVRPNWQDGPGRRLRSYSKIR
jgi:hypothetical protein